MARRQIDHLLNEIAHLSPGEREELMHAMLQPSPSPNAITTARLSVEAVRQAVALRERIRARLHAAHQPFGSVSDDLEAIRGELDDVGSSQEPAS